MRRLGLGLLGVWVGGCGAGADPADAFAAVASSDLSELARVAVAVGEDTESESMCVEGPGDCMNCIENSGNMLSGGFTAGLDTLPCTVGISRPLGEVEYTVVSSQFAGSWGRSGTEIAINMDGSRAATLEVTGPKRSGSYDTIMTVDSMGMLVEPDGTIRSWSADLSYQGLSDTLYTLSLSATGDEVTGSATAGEVLCTLGGTYEAPTVDCGR